MLHYSFFFDLAGGDLKLTKAKALGPCPFSFKIGKLARAFLIIELSVMKPSKGKCKKLEKKKKKEEICLLVYYCSISSFYLFLPPF